MRRLLLTCLILLFLSPASAFAVYEKKDGFPWNLTLHGEHDKPIAQALPNGSFFMNVGPTGIRAQITHEHPAYFTVKFVFPNSPAAGKIKAGDIIVGANNHVMDVPHQFGRRNVTGWAGPMEEMAKLIEDSQGKDGELELLVWPGGDKSKGKKVEIKIRAVGRFSKTFPYNCERSDKLMIELCDFLDNEYQRNGDFGRLHTHTASTLALMASGQNKYTRTIERVMSRYPAKRYDSMSGSFLSWSLGHDGIVMGEYYLLSKDKRIVKAVESLAVAAHESQSPVNGGYSHRTYPFIARRVAGGGPSGYGPMSGVTGLVFTAHSLFRAGGLPYSEDCHERMSQGYIAGWNGSGSIGYGMESWHHAVIQPVGESVGKATNEKGIGYPVPNAMEKITQFKVLWPTDKDRRGGPTDWLNNKQELAKAKVYLSDKSKYVIVRDMTSPGLTRAPRLPTRPVSHIFRSGCAAIGYGIGNDDPSWQAMSQVYAHACAASPNAILDGHASTLLHTLWGSLGAARAGKEKYAQYMQGMKWWFIMAQTHDGSFVPMPGRDYASTDHVYAGRNFPTATAALLLSVKQPVLRITGATGEPITRPARGSSSDSASSDSGNNTSRSTTQTTLLGDDFKIEHCEKEARALNADAPYAQVLLMLDHAMAEPGDYGRESIFFGMALREWITERNQELTALAQKSPATALARGREHARRLIGYELPDAAAVRDLIEKLQDDPDTRTLARYIDRLDAIKEAEERRGATDSTAREREQMTSVIEKFLAKPGISDLLVAEARAILNSLQPATP